MFFRKYWIPLLVFIIAIVGVGLYVLQTRPPKDPILIVKPVEYEKPAAKAPVGEQSAEVGHFHEDGTWHAGAHETPVDRPVLSQLPAQETPKFVKPVSDSQDVTIADRVIASGDVPDRGELEAMSDEKLSELIDDSYEKAHAIAPEMYNKMREWSKVVGDLTRHAKTRAETNVILAEHADTVAPLANAMDTLRYEHALHQLTGNRAFKVWQARFFIKDRDFVDPNSLTDEFWAAYWSDF